MKKGKNIFIIILNVLLLTLSLSAISLYDNAKDNVTKRYDQIEYYYQDELQMFVVDLAMRLDDEYEPLKMNGLSLDQKTYIEDVFDDNLISVRSFINSDKDFYYRAKNTKTNQTISNIENNLINKDNSGYYVKLNYNEQGILKLEGDLQEDIYSNLNDVIRKYYYYIDEYSSNIKVNTPTNLEIEYMIPKVVTSDNGITTYFNSFEQYIPFITTMALILSAIVILFIVIYPIKYVELANPFKIVKEWRLEINILLWATVISLVFMGVVMCGSYTISNELKDIIVSYGISFYSEILLIANIIIWVAGLLSVAITTFILKYIVVYGPIKYLKDHTLVASICRYIKDNFNKLTKFEFNSKLNYRIIILTIINMIIIIIMILLGPIGIILAIIYSCLLLGLLLKKTKEIENDYNTLLSSIKNIISEDFDKISEKDFGVFETSKNELNQLNDNFKEAIQEKVKSQKLKTELITNVSHDLKTPLTCIKNYITLLDDENLSKEDYKHYLEQVNLYSNRLKGLIEDLFEISKVDSGNIHLNFQELDIIALLDQVYLENEELLEPKNLQVIKKYNADKVMMNLDSEKTYRIFENLFTNIGKYALDNSRVYLTLNDCEDCVDIEFSNISEVAMDFDINEITDRFIRGDKSRSKEGSGLGLAIAKSFTEAQNGSFDISVDCDLFKVKIHFNK